MLVTRVFLLISVMLKSKNMLVLVFSYKLNSNIYFDASISHYENFSKKIDKLPLCSEPTISDPPTTVVMLRRHRACLSAALDPNLARRFACCLCSKILYIQSVHDDF